MSGRKLDFYQDEKYLPPAAEPQSRTARVYEVSGCDMPGNAPHSINKMMSHAKRRHSKVTGFDLDALTARKICETPGEEGGSITVVVVEP